jgi:CBS domain-containing protein
VFSQKTQEADMPNKRAIIDSGSLKKLQETREYLRQVESFPYSEELRSVMDTSVYTCLGHKQLKTVLRDMARRNISSAIVVDEGKRPVGILTERDIMQRVVTADCLEIQQAPVSTVMTPKPVTLSPENTIYRALSMLAAHGIKHLPLVENDVVTGIITLRRLLKLRYPEPMTLMEQIREAADISLLKTLKNKLPAMAASRIKEGRRAYDIVVMLSLINQDLHRRCLELALAKVGDPPAAICLYVTGSHGRLENLLAPDQDHGMIIADAPGDPQYAEYYSELTGLFSNWLAEIGFASCPGYIMCSNPLWRKSLGEWKLQIQYWFERQVREVGRFCTVLFDAVPIFGEHRLFMETLDFAHGLLQQHHEVFRVLYEEEGRHRVPTGLLGRFITEKEGEHRGQMDIKRSGLLFVVEAIRLLALVHGIRETATLKRISALVAGNFIHRDDGEYFEAAYLFLLHLALKVQTENIIQGRLDTYIDPKKMSQHERDTLRHAFKAVSALQDLVAGWFGEPIL